MPVHETTGYLPEKEVLEAMVRAWLREETWYTGKDCRSGMEVALDRWIEVGRPGGEDEPTPITAMRVVLATALQKGDCRD